MPEPLLYLQAMGAAAVASVIFVLVIAGAERPVSTLRLNSACVLGMGLGLSLGYYALSLRLAWPPMNGLDRLLTIVVPATLAIELFAGIQRVPRWVAWLLRIGLSATIPRILLHGSVYLSGSDNGWAFWQAIMVLALCGGLLAGSWSLLSCLSQRHPGVPIPLALCLTILCAGLTVMMAGYINGGSAAFPLAATLLGTAVGANLIGKRTGEPTNLRVPAILGIGVVGLFGFLFIGIFFGRLATGSALAMFLAPHLCWVTEGPLRHHWKPSVVRSVQLALIAILLIVVVVLAKRDFDRGMLPLLGKAQEFTLPSNSTTRNCLLDTVLSSKQRHCLSSKLRIN